MSRAAAKSPAPSVAPKPQVPTAESEAARVTTSLGPGAALPTTTRARMERAFGQSFGDVRVHTDGAAARATAHHDAAALTVGSNVAFAPGMFQPGTARGDHLIAHELAHVVQQAGHGSVAQARSLHSVASEGAEQQAEGAAHRVASGRSAGVARGGFALSTRARVMRRARAMTSSIPMMTSTPVPGAGITTTRSALSPALTTQVSPAGGRMAGVGAATSLRPGELRNPSPGGMRSAIVARATATADRQKTPDQAQTPIAKDPASPPSAMVSGAPAGATAGEPAGGEPGRDAKGERGRGKKKKGGRDRDGKDDKEKNDETPGRRRRGGGGPGGRGGPRRGRTRRFGAIPGDRGAAAARRALQRLERRTTAQQHHEPPARRIADARRAVEPPPTEQASRAQGRQVSTVAGEPPPQTDAARARQTMESAVDRAAPSDMEAMSSFDPAQLRAQVGGTVSTQVGAIESSLGRVNAVPAPDPTVPRVDPPATEAAPNTPAPRSALAVPPPVPDATLDASEYQEDAASVFEQSGVSEQARQNASEGPLREMRNQEEGIDQAVESAGNRVRESEQGARAQARSELQAADEEAESAMASTRERAESRVRAQQDTTRTGEQTDRQSVTEQIEGMYTATATIVNGQLSTLTQTTTERFDTDQTRYLDEFRANTRRDIERYKDDRYSTPVVGWGRWLKDRFVSINNLPRVKAIYQTNRDAYVGNITTLIERLTAEADAVIATCRLLIVTTKVAIEALVAAQPTRLRAEAEAAQARVTQQFGQLERQIEQTGNQVRNALEARRERAMEAVDQALAEIQAENASLVDRLVAFVEAIYNALKQFFELMVKIEEMGIGTFLSRALEQAKNGVKNHLWNELKQAFQEWLMMKLSFLQPLMALPSNFLEVLAAAAMNVMNLFLEALPEALPALGIAAMTWLAIQLAAKLIPGVGAIMAVIDAIRAAWSLIQSLIRAASAFFSFLLLVAGGGDGSQQFARALAWGIIAAVDALLTFLGVDSLLRRIARPIARPMGRIFGRLAQRRSRARGARQARRRRERDDDRQAGHRRGEGHNRERTERSRARAERRDEGRRRQTRAEREASRSPRRSETRRRDPAHRRAEDRRRRQREQERQRRERLERARRELPPRIGSMLDRGVGRLRLRATLGWWRARYRLRVLRAQAIGNRLVFEAANSPAVTLVTGYTYDRDQLLAMLERIADRLFRVHGLDSEDASATRRMERDAQRGGGTSEGAALPSRPSDDLRLAARQRARNPRQEQQVVHGPREPSRGAPVSETRQAPGYGRETEAIRRGSRAGTGAMDYDAIVQSLTSAGHSPQAIAGALRSLQTGAGIPASFRGQAGALALLRNLMFNVEVQRERRNAIFSPMAADLMARGSSPGSVLGRATGLHPATQIGAAAGFTPEGSFVPPPTYARLGGAAGVAAARSENRRRQIELLRVWFSQQVAAGNEPAGKSLRSLEQFITRWVEQHYQLAVRRSRP